MVAMLSPSSKRLTIIRSRKSRIVFKKNRDIARWTIHQGIMQIEAILLLEITMEIITEGILTTVAILITEETLAEITTTKGISTPEAISTTTEEILTSIEADLTTTNSPISTKINKITRDNRTTFANSTRIGTLMAIEEIIKAKRAASGATQTIEVITRGITIIKAILTTIGGKIGITMDTSLRGDRFLSKICTKYWPIGKMYKYRTIVHSN